MEPTPTSDASNAFAALAADLRAELKRHCYRMMGAVQDAEDCVQEALLRGWRDHGRLRDPGAARAWLYSIATRVCLDALRTRRRRQTLFGPSLDEAEPGGEPWIEPWPESQSQSAADMRLAFVSLLHGLSPKARAVFLLHDGAGMTAAEAAQALGLSLAAARSALQRARAALPPPAPASPINLPVDAYVAAWNAGDLNALIGLLHRDIVMTMPPWHRTFVGRDAVQAFMTMVWPRYDAFRATATTANGQPAIALHTRRDGVFRAHSLHVLSGDGAVREMVLYAPPLAATLFPFFGCAVEP
jgi:RNA polymerase sigma-70 factor (ECF subfamily)